MISMKAHCLAAVASSSVVSCTKCSALFSLGGCSRPPVIGMGN
jgi:hypothetical protein